MNLQTHNVIIKRSYYPLLTHNIHFVLLITYELENTHPGGTLELGVGAEAKSKIRQMQQSYNFKQVGEPAIRNT